jgi:hypothetical protein
MRDVRYLTEARDVLAYEAEDGRTVVVDAGRPGWAAAVAAGPAAFVPPPPEIPQEVSRFQGLAALMDAGLLADVNAALAAAGPLAQLAWAEASVFRRHSPLIAAMAAGFGLTEEQVDALFVAAAQIEV